MIKVPLRSLSFDSSVVRVSGGLGNQLSQLAFSISLANETRTQSYLDLDSYSYVSRDSDRLPLLHLLNPFSNRIICSTALIKRCLILFVPKAFRSSLGHQHERELSSFDTYLSKEIIKENGFPYDSNLQFRKNSYYMGNFISAGYWKKYSLEILQIFNLLINAYALSKKTSYMFGQLKTLGIHSRRGDYLSNSKTRNFHGYCGDSYFMKAVSQAIENQSGFDQIWISSDSTEYASHLKEKLTQFKIPVFVDFELDPILVLYKLSNSSSFIGSNSTFSWWAGNLGVDKDLYFPSKWFADSRYDFKIEDFYLESPQFINIPLET